jgi:hypothetical protein
VCKMCTAFYPTESYMWQRVWKGPPFCSESRTCEISSSSKGKGQNCHGGSTHNYIST